jgi:REP element-mobilizing transposase RayT
MLDHFRLLVLVNQPPRGLAMRSLETRDARHHNGRHRQVGHVFQARYRAILCDKDRYLLERVWYLHLNPVRAGLVSRPEEWLWSSHRAYVGLETTSWLYQDDVLASSERRESGWSS